MNKKIWGILGATVLSLSATTQLSFANEQESTSNMQVAAYSVRSQANANQIINFAKQQLGKPYAWGATGPNSFDCSGFIYYVFSHNGYGISRTSVSGYWSNSNIQKISKPKPGDLIFFKGTYGGANNPSHIGIVINDSQFIQASSTHGVCITDIDNSYWKQHFLGYGRIIPDEPIKVPVYRVEASWFEGLENAQREARVIKDKFGLNGEVQPIYENGKYRLVTGWFEGIDKTKSELQLIKDKFGLEGELVPNTDGEKYKLETGWFKGEENTKQQLQLIKDKFGLNGKMVPTGNPDEYTIVIDGIENEKTANDIQKKLESIQWSSSYWTPSNKFKIILKGFNTREEAEKAQEHLNSIQWKTTFEECPTNKYKIVINGLLGEQAAQEAQRQLNSIQWSCYYEFTGEYRSM
ncbi:C40 family peptidase [Paraclostridium sp. MRS3W1]|uniref:C40 family peptidase n=1 Tax=Paraclostridium TaxID=1849822 RepID=UPI001A9A3763|nr:MULTISPECIES: C40 family peptidase [Paraclostridium]MDU0296376.1 C40 family peptidase [Paraclostridium sp. MRS3W1]